MNLIYLPQVPQSTLIHALQIEDLQKTFVAVSGQIDGLTKKVDAMAGKIDDLTKKVETKP